MKIAVLGTGTVGQTLAKGLAELNHEVVIGSREGSTAIEEWSGKVSNFKDATRDSELVILAVKGTAAVELVKSISSELKGQTVIDTTNPISDNAPEDGVLKFFTKMNESLMEELQAAAPEANFVKAFNCVGAGAMVNPKFESKPTMFICGNDKNAKAQAKAILDKFCWETNDLGTAKAARAIEPLCMLWCIPGMLSNDWNHALKMLR